MTRTPHAGRNSDESRLNAQALRPFRPSLVSPPRGGRLGPSQPLPRKRIALCGQTQLDDVIDLARLELLGPPCASHQGRTDSVTWSITGSRMALIPMRSGAEIGRGMGRMPEVNRVVEAAIRLF